MDNNFEKGLQDLEDLAQTSWAIPFTNRIIVNSGKIENAVSELRLRLPGEMKRAQELVANRDQIMTATQTEAKTILDQAKKSAEELDTKAKNAARQVIEQAKQQAEQMISEQEIVRQAQERAEAILKQAREDSLHIRTSTLEYVNGALDESARSLQASFNALNQAKKSLTADE